MTLPALLDCRAIMTELGVKRTVAEAIMRQLPKIRIPGVRKVFDRQWDDPDSRSDDLVDLEHAAYLLSMETDTYCDEHLPKQLPTEKARVR